MAPNTETYLNVDKLMLFGILYTENILDARNGNQVKALLFYHLLNSDDILNHIFRSSKRLKKLVYYMFELS